MDFSYLIKIASEFGSPTYAYYENIIAKQYEKLKEALSKRVSIHYAVKANSNLSILKLLSELGACFDVVSEGELRRVFAAWGKASNTVFSGVGKTKEELQFALKEGIKAIHVESISELYLIENIAREMELKAPVALRVNPDIKVETHPYLTTALKTSKFGISGVEAKKAADYVLKSEQLILKGFSCHLGSELSEAAPYQAAALYLKNLHSEFASKTKSTLYIDLGGGQAISYSEKQKALDLDAFKEIIDTTLKDIEEILIEPGKYLVANSGVLISEVLYVKDLGGEKTIILDAGMNDLMRPSLYGAKHRIEAINSREQKTCIFKVFGPVCESACSFGNALLPNGLKSGDLIGVFDVGAYGMSMASNYNSRRLAAEVLIRENGDLELIRKRETYDSLFLNEL